MWRWPAGVAIARVPLGVKARCTGRADDATAASLKFSAQRRFFQADEGSRSRNPRRGGAKPARTRGGAVLSSGAMALFAVLVVAVAASCINVGKALQKEGTKKLPRLVLDRKVLATYFQDSTWAAGMALDVCGGLLMVVAISRAPVSLVQPVAAGGVAVLAVFSHFRLGEKLEPRAWAGVAASVVGTVGIGITSEDQPPAELSTFRYLLGAALIAVMLVLPAHLAERAGRRRARDGKKIVGLVGVGVGTPHHLRHGALASGAAGAPVATAAEPRRWWRARRLAPSSPSPRWRARSVSSSDRGAGRGSRWRWAPRRASRSPARGWCAKPGGSKTATASSCARAETSRRWSPRWCSGWWFWGSVYRARGGLRTWLMSWTLILAGVVAISGVKVEDLPVKDLGDAARGLGGLGGSADCEDEEGTRG